MLFEEPMRVQSTLFAFATLAAMSIPLAALQPTLPPRRADQQESAVKPSAVKPEDTEVWQPVPKAVIPGVNNTAPPSDAIVLFDGTSLDQWVSTPVEGQDKVQDKGQDKTPAKWREALCC